MVRIHITIERSVSDPKNVILTATMDTENASENEQKLGMSIVGWIAKTAKKIKIGKPSPFSDN